MNIGFADIAGQKCQIY